MTSKSFWLTITLFLAITGCGIQSGEAPDQDPEALDELAGTTSLACGHLVPPGGTESVTEVKPFTHSLSVDFGTLPSDEAYMGAAFRIGSKLNATGILEAVVANGAKPGRSIQLQCAPIKDRNWHYFSVIRTSTQLALYLDGKLQDSAALGASVSSHDSEGIHLRNTLPISGRMAHLLILQGAGASSLEPAKHAAQVLACLQGSTATPHLRAR